MANQKTKKKGGEKNKRSLSSFVTALPSNVVPEGN